MRMRSPLLMVVGSVAIVLIVLALGLTFMDWNRLKGPIERSASAHFGRPIHIAGPLRVRLWATTPTITLSGLTVGNPPWEPGQLLLSVERAQMQLEVLPLLGGRLVFGNVALTHPDIYLHREHSGRVNWGFENEAPTAARNSRPALPVMHDLVIEGGRLVLIDEIRKLKVTGTIEARAASSPGEPKPFHIEGTGTINDGPFKVDVNGGPLRALKPDEPYPFFLAITAGENRIEAQGKLLQPFDLAAFELQVTASGRDLAELFYLTQITLPNSPPYKVQAHITRHDMTTTVRQIAGSFGESDVSGTVDIDATAKRPLVKADLTSRHLLLGDFAAVTGSEASGGTRSPARPQPGAAARQPSPSPQNAPRLFPDARLQVERLRAIDAEVHFRATSVEAGSVPVTEVDLTAKLRDGVLTLEPLHFDFAQGRITSDIRMDGGEQPPRVHADLRASNLQLSQFKGKRSGTAPLEGILDGHGVIDGRGASVREVLADGSGRFVLVIPSGNIDSAFAELTGVDVAAGLGLMLRKSGDRAAIRCGAAQFVVQSGVANAQDLAFDTQNVLINGSGRIYLGSERLDLTIEGHPKKFRLVRVRAPIQIRGEILQPKFQLEAGHALKQGAIGAVLGAVATPFAALLAFVDPGLAKDQDCAEVLAPQPATATLRPAPASR